MIWSNLERSAGQNFYVSTNGNDADNGFAPSTPLKTAAAAMAKMKPNQGDRIYLRRGDTFIGPTINWKSSSLDPSRPAGIFAYGDPATPRPILICPNDPNVITCYDTASNVAFVGLDLLDSRLPTLTVPRETAGIKFGQYFNNVLIEDCSIHGFSQNVSILNNNTDPKWTPSRNVRIRGCGIMDAWGFSEYNGQGIYAENLDGLTVEDSFVFNNGYNPDGSASVYRHGMYLSHHGVTNSRVQRSIVAHNSGFGVQMRLSGIIAENIFVDNGCSLCVGGDYGRILRNFIYGSHDVAQQVMYGAIAANASDCIVEANTVMDPIAALYKGQYASPAIDISTREWTAAGLKSTRILDNYVHSWPGPAFMYGGNDDWDSLIYDNNGVGNVKAIMVARRKATQFIMSRWSAISPLLPNLFDLKGSSIEGAVIPVTVAPLAMPLAFVPMFDAWRKQRYGNWDSSLETGSLLPSLLIRVSGIKAAAAATGGGADPTKVAAIKLQAQSIGAQLRSAMVAVPSATQMLRAAENQANTVANLVSQL